MQRAIVGTNLFFLKRAGAENPPERAPHAWKTDERLGLNMVDSGRFLEFRKNLALTTYTLLSCSDMRV